MIKGILMQKKVDIGPMEIAMKENKDLTLIRLHQVKLAISLNKEIIHRQPSSYLGGIINEAVNNR